MNFIIAWLVKKIGVGFVIIGVQVLYAIFIAAYVVFIFKAIKKIIFVFQNLLTYIQGFGGGSSALDIVSYFNGYMSVVGFWDGFMTVFPLFSASLVFLITSIAYKHSLKAYKAYVLSIQRAADAL